MPLSAKTVLVLVLLLHWASTAAPPGLGAGDQCVDLRKDAVALRWCRGQSLTEIEVGTSTVVRELGTHFTGGEVVSDDKEVFTGGSACGDALWGGVVTLRCCEVEHPSEEEECAVGEKQDQSEMWLRSTRRDEKCVVHAEVCSPQVCQGESSDSGDNGSGKTTGMHSSEIRALRDRAKAMFTHAFDGYMKLAYPRAELHPLSCKGGKFSLADIPALTLIDTLDTFAAMNDPPAFQSAVDTVLRDVPNFDIDVNVSVFETNIRALGGLLSGHILASTPQYGFTKNWVYEGGLLRLAVDLADRLCKAFKNGKPGIPFGTVNLRYGVPSGETAIASVAGAGSLTLEFLVVSLLSGNATYARLASHSSKYIYEARSPIGLVGKHIHSATRQWTETGSGIGTNADSYYEYLLKASILVGDESSWLMFEELYEAVMTYVADGEWYPDVYMVTGEVQRQRIEGLLAFWPGLQTLVGDIESAADTMNALMAVWRKEKFLPEGYEYATLSFGTNPIDSSYLLRPELIESLVYLRKATSSNTWLEAGKTVLESLEAHCKTRCGYASVAGLNTNTLYQQDTMPSYFLSETTKYLYMLFDDALTPGGHWMLSGEDPWVFSTEAHPFPIKHLRPLFGENISVSLAQVMHDRPPVTKQCPAGQLFVRGYDEAYALHEASPTHLQLKVDQVLSAFFSQAA